MIGFYVCWRRVELASKSWHAKSPEETLKELNSAETGLSQAEAQKRLAEYGPNELKKEKRTSPIKMFLEQFTDILIIILLIATALSLAVGEIIDAIVIIAIVLATAILGFVEEFRSEKAVEALRKMTAPTATMFRDGREVEDTHQRNCTWRHFTLVHRGQDSG